MTRSQARWLIALVFCAVWTSEFANGQSPGNRTMARNGWRWQSPDSGGIMSGTRSGGFSGGLGYVAPYYGSGYGYGYPLYGYPLYDYGFSDGWQTASRYQTSQNVFVNQGAGSNEAALEAQLKYLEQYDEMQRERKAANEARKAKEAEERKARRARNLARPKKQLTDFYPRLMADQLDRTTGKIVWPDSLQHKQFDRNRELIEAELQFIVGDGPNLTSATTIRTLAEEMKKQAASIIKDSGFETYSDVRKFLNSLSAEGYYAMDKP